jgi:hypothetical protein
MLINVLFRLNVGNQQRKVSENSYPVQRYTDGLQTLYLGHNAHPLHFLNYVEIGYEKRYSFCLIVEASDHGHVLHTRRIYVFSINGG